VHVIGMPVSTRDNAEISKCFNTPVQERSGGTPLASGSFNNSIFWFHFTKQAITNDEFLK
jgi:hypothetical protein